MFGYVLINKPELKIREFERYRSYYCGLCHALNEDYGLFGRLTLNYDMTFLVMLLSDLYDEEDKTEYSRCILHPVHKHCSRRNEITEYCADMCILLTYYKCADDWNDEKKLSKKLWAGRLKRKCRTISEKYPPKSELINTKLILLAETEKEAVSYPHLCTLYVQPAAVDCTIYDQPAGRLLFAMRCQASSYRRP